MGCLQNAWHSEELVMFFFDFWLLSECTQGWVVYFKVEDYLGYTGLEYETV